MQEIPGQLFISIDRFFVNIYSFICHNFALFESGEAYVTRHVDILATATVKKNAEYPNRAKKKWIPIWLLPFANSANKLFGCTFISRF